MRDTLPVKNREKQNQNEHYMFQSCSAMVLKPLTLKVRLSGMFQDGAITDTTL
jgi:hypothetical protein